MRLNLVKFLFTLSAPLFGVASAVAAPLACDRCEDMAKIRVAIEKKNEAAVDVGRALVQHYQFSADKKQRRYEIEAFVDLARKLLPADSTGDSDSYFHEAYKERPQEFDAQINRLDAESKKVLRDSLASEREIAKDGNGAMSTPKTVMPKTATPKPPKAKR